MTASAYSYRQFKLFLDEPADLTGEAVSAAAPPAGDVATLDVCEVLGFDARLLGALPAPSTLVCLDVACERVVITTSQVVFREACRSWPTFVGSELAAMALAAEHERASAEAFIQWCDRKREISAWRLTVDAALGAVTGRFDPRGWSIGRVLGWYGVRVLSVEVDDEQA